MRDDLTDVWGSCGVSPAWVSGVMVMNMVSSDATVTWIPLDRDSWDFLVNLRSVWEELWSKEIAYFLIFKQKAA